MANISYYRHGGRRPPADREILTLETGGAFTMWRSVGAASHPPAPCGRYAGRLDAEPNAALQQAAAAAAAAGNLDKTPPPDAAIEEIEVDRAHAQMGHRSDPGGPWAVLAKALRKLLGELTAFPQAVIAAEVAPDFLSARLVHQGPETLKIDLSALALEAVLWREGNALAFWNAPMAAPDAGEVMAGPGWSIALPFDHGFDLAGGATVAAYVTFLAYDGESAILVKAETRP